MSLHNSFSQSANFRGSCSWAGWAFCFSEARFGGCQESGFRLGLLASCDCRCETVTHTHRDYYMAWWYTVSMCFVISCLWAPTASRTKVTLHAEMETHHLAFGETFQPLVSTHTHTHMHTPRCGEIHAPSRELVHVLIIFAHDHILKFFAPLVIPCSIFLCSCCFGMTDP